MTSKPYGKSGCWWLALSAGALLAALVGVVVLALQRPPHPTLALPDGSRVTLLPASSSTDLAHVGNPLQMLLRRTLPAHLRDRVGTVAFTEFNMGDFSFRLRSSPPQRLVATVFDEHGDETAGEFGQPQSGTVFFSFNYYPRRGRTTGLRLYAPDGTPELTSEEGAAGSRVRWTKLGEFTLPSPHEPYPIYWNKPVLPVSAMAGDLRLMLNRLDVGDNLAYPGAEPSAGETFASVTVRLQQPKRRTDGWDIDLEAISDASGNIWYGGSPRRTQRGEEIRLRFTTPPRPVEEVWKLKFRLVRNDTAVFEPFEVGKWRNLPRPAAGQSLRLGASRRIQGVSVQLAGVYGIGTRPLAPYHNHQLESSMGVVVRVPRQSADSFRHTVLRLATSDGGSIGFNWVAVASTTEGILRLYEADTPAVSQGFDFAYALHQGHTVEFIAPRTLLASGTSRNAVK